MNTKNKISTLLIFILLTGFGFSQTPSYISDINAQLRHIFSDISFPDNDVLFLYDRSVKLSDTVFYDNNCADTANPDVWIQIYKEMYYAAHDTLPLEKVEEVQDYAYQFGGDTLAVALMDYDYYRCKKAALNTGGYFIFDTINNLFHDKSNPVGSPYTLHNLFIASTLKNMASFSNPVFRIDPNLIFTDNNNISYYNNSNNHQNFRIDFGDGTGWHYFDATQVSFYQANYPTQGKYVTNVQVLNKDGGVLKSSKSTVFVLKSIPFTPPSKYLTNIPGMDVGVYTNCNPSKADKVIIYLEGFDLTDFKSAWNRSVS